jgi:hypothetical protein
MARPPAPKRTRVCQVWRKRLLPQDGGATLFFTIHGISSRARFAEPSKVTSPSSGSNSNKMKLGYVFLRQVERPSYLLYWYG